MLPSSKALVLARALLSAFIIGSPEVPETSTVPARVGDLTAALSDLHTVYTEFVEAAKVSPPTKEQEQRFIQFFLDTALSREHLDALRTILPDDLLQKHWVLRAGGEAQRGKDHSSGWAVKPMGSTDAPHADMSASPTAADKAAFLETGFGASNKAGEPSPASDNTGSSNKSNATGQTLSSLGLQLDMEAKPAKFRQICACTFMECSHGTTKKEFCKAFEGKAKKQPEDNGPIRENEEEDPEMPADAANNGASSAAKEDSTEKGGDGSGEKKKTVVDAKPTGATAPDFFFLETGSSERLEEQWEKELEEEGGPVMMRARFVESHTDGPPSCPSKLPTNSLPLSTDTSFVEEEALEGGKIEAGVAEEVAEELEEGVKYEGELGKDLWRVRCKRDTVVEEAICGSNCVCRTPKAFDDCPSVWDLMGNKCTTKCRRSLGKTLWKACMGTSKCKQGCELYNWHRDWEVHEKCMKECVCVLNAEDPAGDLSAQEEDMQDQVCDTPECAEDTEKKINHKQQPDGMDFYFPWKPPVIWGDDEWGTPWWG